MPAVGGKISSLRRNGVELLQNPLRPYARRTMATAFEDSDASGFDECLPSVSACEIDGGLGPIQIPDHGEFWRLPCHAEQRSSVEVGLTATGSVLPLRLERTLKLEYETLRIEYRLENVSQTEVPYIWSAHPLFSVDPGDAIVAPSSISKVHVEASAHARLGTRGSIHRWPIAQLPDGEKIDLGRAGDISDEIGDKLYTSAPREGWAAIERRQAGFRLEVGFDPQLSPYLGFWLCYGGWPEGQPNRQQCVAIEPCTAPGDSLADALESGCARRLAPGEPSSWWMTINVSAIS